MAIGPITVKIPVVTINATDLKLNQVRKLENITYESNFFNGLATDGGDRVGMSAADNAKKELDRYLHFYQRYHAHDVSLKFASQQRVQAEQKMLEQQQVSNASWNDVQFVKQAVEQVIECRRVLKFTYALGYFLKDEPGKCCMDFHQIVLNLYNHIKGKKLFEHHQEMLEKNTETLQEFTEAPLDKMDRVNIVNLTRVIKTFLDSMLDSAANIGIDDGILTTALSSSSNDSVSKSSSPRTKSSKSVNSSPAASTLRTTRSQSRNASVSSITTTRSKR